MPLGTKMVHKLSDCGSTGYCISWVLETKITHLNMLCNLKCNYPPHIAYIVTHNRCANMSGKEGKAKPLDQLIEHYNL